MAYQMSMAKYSLKYQWPSLVVYDINYRQKQASHPESSLAITDGGLFAESFTGMMRSVV